MASVEGSIQALSETVELQRQRANLAEAKVAIAQRKLSDIALIAQYVLRNEHVNRQLRGFAEVAVRILDGETEKQ